MSLTIAEDYDLRRLAMFDRVGFLDDGGVARLSELRARDRRREVRAVEDPVEHLPALRQLDPRPRTNTCTVYPV
jgi:hypothetical protein